MVQSREQGETRLETQITYTKGRTARARLRGTSLVMTIPRHWPRSEQEAAIAKFQRWGQRQKAVLAAVPALPPSPPLSLEALTALVERVNRETVQVRYAGVRIGRARYTRLAQVNLNTRILTFSRYAVDGMPERALRYLILHELAHLVVPDHSRAFWAVVSRHMPDYREQRRVAQHHFQLAGHAEPTSPPPAAPSRPAEPAPVPSRSTEGQQLRLF